MKKIIIACLAVFLLVGCSSNETTGGEGLTETQKELAEKNTESFNIMVKAKEEGRNLTQQEMEQIHQDVSQLRWKFTTDYHRYVEQMFYSFNNEDRFNEMKASAEQEYQK